LAINVLPSARIDLLQRGRKRETPPKVRAHFLTFARDVSDVSQPFKVMKGPFRITDLLMNTEGAKEILFRLWSLLLCKRPMASVPEYAGDNPHHGPVLAEHFVWILLEFL
jgi:hypothetical protein